MSFAFQGFQSRQQYSSRGMTRDFKSVSMREQERANTLNTHPILSLSILTIFQLWRVKVAVLLIIMPRSLTCSLSSMFVCCCMLLQILFPILFHIAEVQIFCHWTSYYLYLPICTAYVNHFVASVCPLHLLFLEGFEYHRQSMILLRPLFRNFYQIYVSKIGGALTLTLGVRHFLLELHLMLFHWRQHIVVCLIGNCVSTQRF